MASWIIDALGDEDDEVIAALIEYPMIRPYYQILLSMFPKNRKSDVRNVCLQNSRLLTAGVKVNDEHLNKLVNELLEDISVPNVTNLKDSTKGRADDWHLTGALLQGKKRMIETEELSLIEKDKSTTSCSKEGKKSEQEKLNQLICEKNDALVRMFPNADPELINNIVKENIHNPEQLQQEVEHRLFSGKYKTRAEYFKKLKSLNKRSTRIQDIEAYEFLKNYSEPFTYFEDPERTCSQNSNGLDFLISRYPNIEAADVERIYKHHKFNLTLVDKNLSKTIRPNERRKFVVEDSQIIDEILFIENKKLIKDYYDHKQKMEEEEIKTLEFLKELIECECCYDKCKPIDCFNCDDLHIFCRKCIIRSLDIAISGGKTSMNCLSSMANCSKEISLKILQDACPKQKFDVFFKRKQEEDLKCAKVDGLEYCPFCSSVQVLPEQETLFICTKEECMKITCRLCKRLNHIPIKCNEVLTEHTGRLYVEEELSKALIRKCHRCGKPFVKVDGCNKMTCICGAQTCYVCRRPSRGYDHSRCATVYTRADLADVEKRRQEVKEKLKRDQPELDIDI